MGITVGAALKKVAVAILAEPKVLKNLGMAVLVVVVAMILPTVFVVSLFTGGFEVDTAELLQYVEANLTAEDIRLLRNVENIMSEIEAAMIDAGLSDDIGAAQALYIMALYNHADQPGFVSRLVSCFAAEQTDAQLISNVNREFGTDIDAADFTNVVKNIRSRTINTTLYVDCGTKNNLDLVQWAISAYQNDWGYVMGTFGQILTNDLLEAKIQQLPEGVGAYEDFIRANYLGVRTADCIGLIKGYSWYDPDTGNINYGSNGMPDISADQIYNQASEKGSIDILSFISLYKHCWKSQSYAAACGISDKALWQMLKVGPHIQKVYLCLDNDEAGRKAAGRIAAQLTEKGIANELLVPDRKDWNEELLHYLRGDAVLKA